MNIFHYFLNKKEEPKGSSTTNHKDIGILHTLLGLLKNNKNEILFVKVLTLIIVNTWLLIIFWKVLLINNVNMIGKNVAVTKMNTLLQPVLMYLGLDILNPSTLTMLMITGIVIMANLTILNFQGMIGVAILLGISRYGYKSYTNYLINKENMAITPTEIIKPVEKAVEQAPIIINTASNTGTNWWIWGTIALVGVIAVGGIIFTIWSHNTNATNGADLARSTGEMGKSLNSRIDLSNQKSIILENQINLNLEATRKHVENINEHFNLLDKKIDNNFTAVEALKDNYEKIIQLNNQNTLELSQKSYSLSEKAVSMMQEMSEVSSATEGVTVALARFYDIITNQNERLTIVESRMDTLSGVSTPRTMGNPINLNPLPLKKVNEL